MKDTSTRPRVLGHRVARVLTEDEIARVNGAHGGGGCQGSGVTGFETADLCCDGVLTGPQCGDNTTQNDIGFG